MGSLLATAAVRTTVSPYWIHVEPEACLATLPTSIRKVRPPSSTLTVSGILVVSSLRLTRDSTGTPGRAMSPWGVLGVSWGGKRRGPLARLELLAESELLDHQPIPLDLRQLEIIEQPSPLTDHPEQPTATVMI